MHLVRIILVICLANLLSLGAIALEFKTEAEKAKWIKEVFKDKEFEELDFPPNTSENDKEFERTLLKDFITQNGIELIEPIASGKSINDPAIAKFNQACPNKKPIDVYYEYVERGFEFSNILDPTEEELEEAIGYIDRYRCIGNIKIYKFNAHNTPDNREEYVLFCDDIRTERFMGEEKKNIRAPKKEPYNVVGGYLKIEPDHCIYPRITYKDYHVLIKNSSTGVFKYRGHNYFFTTGGLDENHTDLYMWKDNSTSETKLYFYHTKPN